MNVFLRLLRVFVPCRQKRADIARVLLCENNFCTEFANQLHFCGLQKLKTLILCLFHPPLNPRNHSSTVLIETNWYTMICKYGYSHFATPFSGCPIEYLNINSNSIVSQDATFDEYQYYLKTSLLQLFNGAVKELIIGDDVTRIGNYAFSDWSNLSSVTLGKSISDIGSYAFDDCKLLTRITIPESVTNVGNSPFKECYSLTSVTVNSNAIVSMSYSTQSSLQNKGLRYIFGEQVKEYLLGDKITNIGEKAFSGCTKLSDITVPSSVTTIGVSAFSGCTGLKSLIIPESVITVGSSAFYGCTNLKGLLNIPNSVTEIGSSAFYNCYGLTDITVGTGLKTIGDHAFHECSGLKSLVLGESVASIGEGSFYGCTGLNSLIIPESVITIGSSAFYGCTNLKGSLNIPNSVTDIGNRAFDGCKDLTSVILNSNAIVAKTYNSSNNFSTIFGTQVKKFVLNSPSRIGDYAFYGCTNMNEMTLPESATSIGTYAFYNCSSDILLLPKSVSVGEKCFENSSGYSYVYTFADNVLELSKTDHDKFFKSCSVYPGPDIMGRSISQSTISISPSSRFTAKTVKINERVFNTEGGSIQYTQLTPNKTYTLTVIGRVRDCDSDYTFDVDLTTRDLSLWLKQTDATNLTLSVEGDNDGDAQIVGYSFLANEVQNSGELARGEWKATGLKPNQRVQVSMTARTVDGYTKTITRSFETRDLDVTFDAQTTGTSATITGSASMIDATYISSCFKESGKDRVTIYGLDPYSSYSWCYYVTTKEGGEVPYYTTFYTQDLYMATQAAQPMTTKKARLIANTNCDDDAMRCGFEWIRYDAPEEMKPTSVSCPVYNGVIMGTLNGVNPDTYYKYRPYYQSNSGQRYYGDWVAFITADASVYFEPEIHTMDASDITSTSAKVRGYAVAGSDDISEQGFEYWTETSGTQRKASSGTLMQTTLSGLTPSTKYFYRSFATAGAKTTYGEEREFTTNPDATSIELIPTDTPERTVVGYYNLQGQRINEPQRGVNIIRYSDGTAKKVLLK